MMLHYADEYKEDAADFEAAMPLRRNVPPSTGSPRRASGGAMRDAHSRRSVRTRWGRPVRRSSSTRTDKGYAIHPPTREVYLKDRE